MRGRYIGVLCVRGRYIGVLCVRGWYIYMGTVWGGDGISRYCV